MIKIAGHNIVRLEMVINLAVAQDKSLLYGTNNPDTVLGWIKYKFPNISVVKVEGGIAINSKDRKNDQNIRTIAR